RSLTEGAPALVDRAELAQVLMGLLQVPSDGLVVLDGVPGARLEPVGELGVQLRTSALEQTPVGSIPDQVVVEAQCRLAEEPGGVGLDQLAAPQRFQPGVEVRQLGRQQMSDRAT